MRTAREPFKTFQNLNGDMFFKFFKTVYLEFLNVIGHFIIVSGIFKIYVTKSKFFFVILTYHYPSEETIKLHLSFVRKYFEIKGFDSMGKKVKGNKTKKTLYITFDDGYQHIFTNLFALFAREQAPFAVFISSKNIEEKCPFWWDAYELRKKSRDKLNENLREIKENDRKKILNLTKQEMDSEFLRNRLPLGWDEIRQMLDSGLMSVGDHGYSHTSLVLLDEKEIKAELLASKTLIRGRLGVEAKDFSYPNGDVPLNAEAVLKEFGYRCGLSTLPSRNYENSDPYFLRRIDADSSKLGVLVLKIMGMYGPFTGFKLERYLRSRGVHRKVAAGGKAIDNV